MIVRGALPEFKGTKQTKLHKLAYYILQKPRNCTMFCSYILTFQPPTKGS
jgi:hypothetical protein